MPAAFASAMACSSIFSMSSRTATSAFSAAASMALRWASVRPCHASSFMMTRNSMSALFTMVTVSITSHSLRDCTPDMPVMPTSTVPRW